MGFQLMRPWAWRALLVASILALSSTAHAKTFMVIGDSLSQGLGAAMARCFAPDADVQFIQNGKINTGLTRKQPLDWVAEATSLAKTKPDAVVMQIGGNDLNPLMVDGHLALVGSDNWKAEYARRVGSIVTAFEDAGTKVFWVGLPYPERSDLLDPYHTINGVIAQQVGSGPVKFYDIWDTFLVDGKYSSYGMDLKNNKVLIRAEDGVHFTAAGYTREANLVVADLATNFSISGADCAH